MKKTYSKPDVLFDSFSLCSAIASCAVKTNLQQEGGCGMQFGFDTIFLNTEMGCQILPDFFGWAEGVDIPCYHVPTDAHNLFTS